MACIILVVNHAGASSNKRPIPRWSILRHSVSLVQSPARLRITSRGIQQPSRPSHDTTQSNKPPIPPAVYIHIFGRASSSENRTETRLGRASHAARPTCIPHLPGRLYRTDRPRPLLIQPGICLRSTDIHHLQPCTGYGTVKQRDKPPKTKRKFCPKEKKGVIQ